MNNQIFSNISKIIERDSKSTTYKFALLRGVIDIIQENSPFISVSENLVEIPLGLLIEKWLVYYFPIFESEIKILQINGENSKLAFESDFMPIIEHYKGLNGISLFYNDIRNKSISPNLNAEFFKLAKKLKDTITKMPMKYIGRSISEDYFSIFNYQQPRRISNSERQNINWLVSEFGTFTIPFEYYEAFKIIGSFVSGTDSIFFKWAEFSERASNKKISTERILHEILKNPVTERDIKISKNLYKKLLSDTGNVNCVWSGIKLNNYDIDHIIPFAIYKNNDLWNLLPAKKELNNNKRDKIPSLETLKKSKDLIIHYWEIIEAKQRENFLEQIQISLLGKHSTEKWQNTAFNQLLNTSKYLIETRGYQEWNY